MSSILSQAEFVDRFADKHSIYAVPGVNRHTHVYDTLHVIDHRGIAGSIAGNVIYGIVKDSQMGLRTQTATLTKINEMKQQ